MEDPQLGRLVSYIWVIGILFALINAYSLRRGAKESIAQNPELEKG